jgi:hypothetical protein
LLWLALWLIPFAGELAVRPGWPDFSDRTLIGGVLADLRAVGHRDRALAAAGAGQGCCCCCWQAEAPVLVSHFQLSRKKNGARLLPTSPASRSPGTCFFSTATWVQIPFDDHSGDLH